MSIILKRTTDDSWPEFGEVFMNVMRILWMMLELIFGMFIGVLALISLIAVPILIVRFSSALYKQWCGRNQFKQGSEVKVVMATIASGGNEQDVEYGVVATNNAVDEVTEHKEGIDG